MKDGWLAKIPRTTVLLGAAVFAVALLLASRGMRWSLYTHPDELPVAKWIGDVARDGYISDRLYPSGWFELARLKVKWEELAKGVSKRAEAWKSQDGAVNIGDTASFRRHEESVGKYIPGIEAGREFNVLLAALSALAVFLACLQFGASAPAAFLAALLLAANPFMMEHSHYCETDMGLVFMLAVSLALMGVWLRRRTPWRCALFALAAGFAISCKYTLLPLVPVVLAAPFACRAYGGPEDGDGASLKWRWRGAVALLAVSALLAGFVLGTPAIYKMPAYFAKVRSSIVHSDGPSRLSEAAIAAAAAAHALAPKWLIRAASLVREMGRLGVPTLAFYALALAFSLRRGSRCRAMAPMVAVFVLFLVFVMSWVRNQETLPLLVMLSVPVADFTDRALAGVRARPRRRAVPAALALCVALAALGSSLAGSLRMTSFFLARETRAECQNFLAASAPDGATILSDDYLGFLERGTHTRFLPSPRLERRYPDFPSHESLATKNGGRYYLRNASHLGRLRRIGDSDPITLKLYPEVAERVKAFRRDSSLLASWKTSEGAFRPAFAQPDVELWALPATPGAGRETAHADVPVFFPRPVLFRYAGQTLYESDRTAPFGPEEAIQTVGRRRMVRFSGTGRKFAVSRNVEGAQDAQVVWLSRLSPRRATLRPGGAAVFTLDEGAMRTASRLSAMPGARLRMRGDDQGTLVLTSVVSTPEEAAYALRVAGEPGRALALLRAEEALSPAGKVEAFRSCAALGEAPEPAWTEAAHGAVAAFRRARAERAPLSVCGVPMEVIADFARIRLGDYQIDPIGEFPVFLPKGRYEVTAVLTGTHIGTLVSNPVFNVQSRPFDHPNEDESGHIVVTGGGIELRRSARLRFNKAIAAGLRSIPTDWTLREVEISWDPLPLVEAEVADISRALGAGDEGRRTK